MTTATGLQPRVAALGLGGASSLLITGSGFSWTPSDNVVTLAGVPCVVTASTLTTLLCSPGAARVPTNTTSGAGIGYPLGRGLLHTTRAYDPSYASSNTWMNSPSTALPADAQWINTDSVKSYCTNCASYFVEDLQGYFIPPVTANYSFWVRGDDSANVWLSPSADPKRVALIASSPGYSTSFLNYASQISTPLSLVAGRPYFFQARHAQQGSWTDFFVGLRIHTTGNAAATAAFSSENQRVYDSVSEVQTVAIQAVNPTRARVVFSVSGVGKGSTFVLRSGSNSYCPDCTNAVYFPSDASASAVQSAIYGYAGCWSFSVARFALGTGYQWNVTLNCPLAGPPTPLTPFLTSLTPVQGVTPSLPPGVLTVPPSAPLGGTARFWYNASAGDPAATPLVASLSSPGSITGSLSAQLLAQPGVSVVSVVNTGYTCNGAACEYLAWQITFTRPYGDVPLLVGDNSSLTGTNAAAYAWTNIQGSTDVFLMPAPMDFFQVRVGGEGGLRCLPRVCADRGEACARPHSRTALSSPPAPPPHTPDRGSCARRDCLNPRHPRRLPRPHRRVQLRVRRCADAHRRLRQRLDRRRRQHPRHCRHRLLA